jgi:AmiR/NasT family two-component response regulator
MIKQVSGHVTSTADLPSSETIRAGLDGARRTGIAIGILMASGRMTEHAAHDLLTRMRQTQNRTLGEVVDDLVITGDVFSR